MKTNTDKPSIYKLLTLPWLKFRAQCQDMRLVLRTQGLKALIKQYGWKFFLVVFCYYLVRDITLYILLPYLVATYSIG